MTTRSSGCRTARARRRASEESCGSWTRASRCRRQRSGCRRSGASRRRGRSRCRSERPDSDPGEFRGAGRSPKAARAPGHRARACRIQVTPSRIRRDRFSPTAGVSAGTGPVFGDRATSRGVRASVRLAERPSPPSSERIGTSRGRLLRRATESARQATVFSQRATASARRATVFRRERSAMDGQRSIDRDQ